jgi:DNA-binding CsgD family transcriptional regulator
MALVDAMRHIPHSRVIAEVKAPDDARSYCAAGDADVVVCDAATMLGDESGAATAFAASAAKELARAEHAATALPGTGRFPWQIEPCQVLALSAREREVFTLLGLGLSNRHVARALGVTELTVKTHVGRVLAKLKLESRLQAGLAALFYLAQGPAR